MKKIYALALLSLLLVPLGLRAQTGTKGNTITFDSNNSTMLFANISGTGTHSYSCYLRHNQAPIQILNANPTASSYTIAPLQDAPGTGTGFFANSSLANNMTFSNDGRVQFLNLASYSTDWPGTSTADGGYKYICFAVIAPRGYRFTEYWMSIDGSQKNGANGATIMRYTYNSTYQYTPCTGESMGLTGSTEQIFSHTLSNAENLLYFRIEVSSRKTQSCVTMNQLRLKYVIDGDVEATLPNSDGTSVHTGYINLGKLENKAGNDYYFEKTNVTDLENVNIVAEDATSEISVKDGVIEVSKGGTYWIESPAKFRITEAKVNFQMPEGSTKTTYEQVTTLESGGEYRLAGNSGNNGNTYYLTLNNNNSISGNVTNPENSTVWTITASGNGYTIYSEAKGLYLAGTTTSSSASLKTQSDPFVWSYNDGQFTYTYTVTSLFGSSNTYTRGIRCNNGQWSAAGSPTTLTFYKKIITSVTPSDYRATLYGTSATSSVGSDDLSASKTSASLTANDLNNDGVKFTVTGAAAFTVELTMEPLDPNLQNLEFGYKSGTVSPNMVSAAATNFQFNNGETIVIPMEQGVSNATTIFRNAFNESRINWYDGTATGLSNYYLVDSEYEKNGSESNAPSDKVDADQAGTNEIQFSNIKTLTANGGTLTETPFNKTNAGYATITLTNSPQTIYIYSADKPEYCIMTAVNKNKNTHVAYTFYDAKVQGYTVDEDPVVTVTELYTSSLKRNNVKAGVSKVPNDNSTDTTHKFYGVEVTSSGTVGYLTSDEIVKSIKTTMGTQEGIYAEDVMRTILYVDMSSLKSISGGADSWREIMMGTGDNCLFFMPSNFSIAQAMPGGGIIAGGENGEAVTDITIHDQQPFFSPYNFRTSTHVAHYERTQTNNKPTVTKSTLVLPFTVKLNANGNPKPASDSENTNVTFYNLEGVTLYTDHQMADGTYLDGVAGQITASPVTTGEATANTPYYVTSQENTAETSFMIEAQGVTFAQTTLDDMTSDKGNMTAHGSFNGLEMPDNDTNNPFLYWSKDYFWYSISETLKDDVKFLPYRAYYTTSAQLAKGGKFMLLFDENGETNGIEDSVSIQQTAVYGVYDLQGRKLSVNSDQLSTLSKGIYIVNGKKIFVK